MFTISIRKTIDDSLRMCLLFSAIFLFCACGNQVNRKRKDYIHDRKMNIYHDEYEEQANRRFVPMKDEEEL